MNPPYPPKKILKKNKIKNKKIIWSTWKQSKLSQIGWNGEKICRKLISYFFTPTSILGWRKCWQKNQTCSKLAKMARKLVRNNFYILHKWGLKKMVTWKNQSYSKLYEINRKMIRNCFWILDPPNPLPPPPHTMGE